MLVKTEKQKMPFVPNFRTILWLEILLFHIAIWMWYISEWLLTVSVFLWIAMVIFFYIWKKKTVKIIEKLWLEYEQKSFYNDFNSIQRKKNILKNLSYLKSKFFIFPKEKEINEAITENDKKIKNLLQDKRNETFAISYIADGLDAEENANFIKSISLPFAEKQKELRRKWAYDLSEQAKILKTIWWIAFFTIYGIPLAFFLFFVLQRTSPWSPTSFEGWRMSDEKSWKYLELLQISKFYHLKLDDFYNLVFHEKNFLPETPLLFADIITLISENFEKRKKFLNDYREFWWSWLELFYILPYKFPEKLHEFKIFQKKIPPEIEKIISKEEKTLENEIKHIQNKIREWAEFEKNKIATISAQNKEFFPNLELSNKRQEILIKNFENLAR